MMEMVRVSLAIPRSLSLSVQYYPICRNEQGLRHLWARSVFDAQTVPAESAAQCGVDHNERARSVRKKGRKLRRISRTESDEEPVFHHPARETAAPFHSLSILLSGLRATHF